MRLGYSEVFLKLGNGLHGLGTEPQGLDMGLMVMCFFYIHCILILLLSYTWGGGVGHSEVFGLMG